MSFFRIFFWGSFLYCFSLLGYSYDKSPIIWRGGDFGGKYISHAALLVEVNFAKKKCLMQLDTGAPDSFYWYAKNDSANKRYAISALGLKREIVISDEVEDLINNCEQSPIGTIGNQYFEHGMLIINFKRGFVSYTEAKELANKEKSSPLFYTPKGHPLIELYENHRLLGYVILDTGSAAVEFGAQTIYWWNYFTDNKPLFASPDVTTLNIPAWGEIKQCYGSTATKTVSIGGRRMSEISINFCPDLGFEFPLQIMGVVGTAMFKDFIVYLDYKNGRWRIENAR